MGDEEAGTTVTARMWGDGLELRSHRVATKPCNRTVALHTLNGLCVSVINEVT